MLISISCVFSYLKPFRIPCQVVLAVDTANTNLLYLIALLSYNKTMEEKPLLKYEAFWTGVMAALHFIFYYSIAIGIWGLALKRSIFWFILSGAIVGLVISLLFVSPVVASQRTKGRIQDMMFAAGSMWGGLSIAIGILGIITWIIRAIFF